MGSGRTRSVRLALVLGLVAVLAGVVAATAGALAFDDATPCPVTIDNGQPLFVCPGGAIGTPYSVQVVARGGCEPAFNFSVINGALPAGLSMSSGGLISGTPTQSGNARFWIRVHDVPPSEGGPVWCTVPKDAEREFKITIDPGLRIITNSLPQIASVGAPYTATLEAQLVTGLNPLTGSTPSNLSWSIVPGIGNGLPPGLALGNGVITGTPTTEGTYTFRVQAAVDATRTHFQTYSLTVRQPLKVTAAKPLATSPAPTLWETGLPFSAKLTPSGGNGTYTFSLGGGTLPSGLALAADGTISGTPNAPGISRATIRLTDGEGRTLDYPANFGVAQKLAISTIVLKPAKAGKLYRVKLTTAGGLPPKTWRVVTGPLPKGIRLDRQLGILSGLPTKPGSYKVTFEAKDGLKVTATKTLRIVVAP